MPLNTSEILQQRQDDSILGKVIITHGDHIVVIYVGD